MLNSSQILGSYKSVILDTFTLFILIELTRSFINYSKTKNLILIPIIDTAILFIIRDIMIFLYADKSDINFIFAISTHLLITGILRIAISYKINHQNNKHD